MSERMKKFLRSEKGLSSSMYHGQLGSSKKRNQELPSYTKEDFRSWLYGQNDFIKLYNNWVSSNFEKDLKPSVDRIDDNKGYSFSNIKLMTWKENREKYYTQLRKGRTNKGLLNNGHKAVLQYSIDGIFIKEFISVNEASKSVKCNTGNISQCCSGAYHTSHGFVWRYKN